MKKKNLQELIRNSNIDSLQQSVLIGLIEYSYDDRNEKKEVLNLIRQVTNEKYISEVILSTDEVKIYTVNGTKEWDIKYPFRIIYVGKNHLWKRVDVVCPTLETALLYYLQYKFIDANSQFASFAIKMLEIQQ